MDGNPLKKKAAKAKDDFELFKKPKSPISKAAARHILALEGAVDDIGVDWLVRRLDTLVRERSYPPQLLSDDFLSLLSRYFDATAALRIAEEVRLDYARAFPPHPAVVEDFKFLEEAIAGDEVARALISRLAVPVADDSYLKRHSLERPNRTQSF
jgi:hypothetical protein